MKSKFRQMSSADWVSKVNRELPPPDRWYVDKAAQFLKDSHSDMAYRKAERILIKLGFEPIQALAAVTVLIRFRRT